MAMASSQPPVPVETSSLEPSLMDDIGSAFYIGHHESKRALPISDFMLRQAQDTGVCART